MYTDILLKLKIPNIVKSIWDMILNARFITRGYLIVASTKMRSFQSSLKSDNLYEFSRSHK